MDITGKIIVACPEQSGTSRQGNPWKKRIYVLETQETYPKKVAFDLFGDRVDQYPLNVGDNVKVSFDINSREFNGRWYTDLSAWKVEPAQAATSDGDPLGPIPTPPPAAPADITGSGNDDILPF